MASNHGNHDATGTVGAVSHPASGATIDAQYPPTGHSSTNPAEQSIPRPSLSQGPLDSQVVRNPESNEKKTTIGFILAQPVDKHMPTSNPPSESATGYGDGQNSEFGQYSQSFSSQMDLSRPHSETLPPDNPGNRWGTSASHENQDTAQLQKSSHRHSGSGFKSENRRPGSMVQSPLTHPNGVSMFPDLSTVEQDEISREALFEAEDTIVADSEEVSTLGDGSSDAGYESDSLTSGSTSMTSSIRDYMYENGRRYHRFREGTYNFPNDDVEQEREDMKHAMIKLLCNQRLHFAPIGEHPQEILDIGTGTGIWAIEMGDEFSSANILGIDLSPIQPDWLPPNVKFMVDDAESPWLHPRNHFDYIHTRHTVMGIKDWPKLFRRAYEHLRPGGWFEMQEVHHKPHSATRNGMVPPEHPIVKYWQLVTDGLSALGVDFHAAAGGNLSNMMREAGFINVTERVFHVPLGTWPKNKVLKTVGLYWRTILMDGMQAIALGPLTRGLGWNREQVELLLVDVRRAYLANTILMYMPCHIIYGQKPEYA